jgi:NifU-like protein involved in Fe-S cluster formation
MDQAVIKLYRQYIKEDFPNSGELENASIFVEAIGQHMIHCGETGNYMRLYLRVEGRRIAAIRYLCSCEPVANVAVEILCGLARGRTLAEAAELGEESFYRIIGSRDEEIRLKVRGLLALLRAGLASYKPAPA